MPKDETLRPFCLMANGAFALMIILSADRDLVRWFGIGIAALSLTAAGRFFREAWVVVKFSWTKREWPHEAGL